MPKGQFTRRAILDWRSKFPDKTLYDWIAEQVANNQDDECWLWCYSFNKRKGKPAYGYVSVGTPLAGQLPSGRRHVEVHRLAFFLRYGYWPLPFGRHTCNNSLCWNPLHVIPGTNQQNVDDMVRAGRHVRGERCWKSILTAEIVRQIRKDRANGDSYRMLAQRYGVAIPTICDVVTGKAWSHVK